MDFLTILKSFVDTMGATVLLPVFIFIFALILGAKVGRAFRAAVTIGVAFIGINLVIGLMWGALSGVSQALVTNVGIERDIVDVGWPAAAAVAFATDVGLWVIPVGLLVNFALLLPGVTKTLNVALCLGWFPGNLCFWKPCHGSGCRCCCSCLYAIPGRLDCQRHSGIL